MLFPTLLLWALMAGVSALAPDAKGPPNVLFIAVDDLRPELGCYGMDHIHSPNIDKLASASTLFINSYCNIPVCGASRASLMTGLRPTLTRFKSYLARADEEAPDVPTLAALFKEHGYTTLSNGKILHHADDSAGDWDEVWRSPSLTPMDFVTESNIRLDTTPGTRGYPFEHAEVHDTAYKDGRLALKTVADLKKLKSSGKPFFLATGFWKPHLPFNAPRKYWDLYPKSSIKLPANRFRPDDVPSQALHNSGELRNYTGVPERGAVSDELARTLIRGYYACVSYTDAQIGIVLDALEELGLDKNTIVVLWGDHGWNLYEHGLWCKHSNYRTSLKAPLIIRKPGQKKAYKRLEMVEFVDIYPTLAELAGFDQPKHLEGNSMVALLGGKKSPWKQQVESVWGQGFTYTSKTHAYTEWLSPEGGVEARMLFDHRSDPRENANIAEEAEYAPLMEKLSGSRYTDP